MKVAAALAGLALVVSGGFDTVVARPAQAAQAVQPGPGSAGMGDPYFPLDGNGGYDVAHYDIHDNYALARERLTGWTRITATARRDLSRFNLDFLLNVRGVSVNGSPAGFWRPNAHELVVRPGTPIAAGSNFRVRVSYRGQPAATGWAGERSWFASRNEVMATNEPHIATWWFPVNDHPRDKARFDFHIAVPNGNQVIANGIFKGSHRGEHWTRWHWRAGDPMASYLAFFAAGRFIVERSTHDGVPYALAVSRQLSAAGQTRALRVLRTIPRVTQWLASQLGTYPFASGGGLVTGLSRNFALENQTRPTYDTWIGKGVVVHETSHEWLGDSVSVRNWRDIWLNEGFATFMQVRYSETHGGADAQQWLLQTWRGWPADDPFWKLKIGNPGKDHIFDWQVYERGAMAVQALRHRIGEADFWTLLRTWVRDRADGNGGIGQFMALAEQTSHEQLDGFFDAWLYTSARPAKTVANGLDGTTRTDVSARLDLARPHGRY